MKKILKTPLLVASLCLAKAATTQAALVAHWNFNALSIANTSNPGSGGVPTTIPADSGTGVISLTGFGGTVDDFAGSPLNAVGADPSEESLSLQGGGLAAPFPGNGTFIEILTLDFTGLSDLAITYATRGTSTGFDTGVWSYSVAGGAFSTVPGSFASRSTTFAVATVDLTAIAALEGASSVTLRYTLSGATSSVGNNRIDNLQIVSDFVPIPEASTTFLGLVAGLGLLRRRR